MNKKLFGMILFLVGILVSSAVAALPVTIEKVKLDGDELSTTAVNRVVRERGETVDVRVLLSSTEDLDDVEVEAFIPGYERGTVSEQEYLDMKKGSTYTKSLSLKLPDRMDKDDYDLKVLVTARGWNTDVLQSYKLTIDPKRHALVIKDVVTSPDDNVKAGRALLVTVRVKNVGDKDEDDIKVTASIPELGIAASDYIDELEGDKATSSEELYLRIPDCANAGEYTLKAVVSYQDGDERVTENVPLNIVESETCEAITPVEGKTTITYSAETQTVVSGAAGVVYPVTLTNEGTTTKTYTLSLDGVEWATTRISPSQVISLKGGETKTAYIYVSANEGAAAGKKMFAVSVSDQSGNVLKQLTLSADVLAGKPTDLSGARRALEIALVALIVVLVIIGLVVAFTRVKGREEGEEGQTYY